MASRTVKGLAVQLAVMQLFTQGLLFHPRKVEAEENQAKESERSNAPSLDGEELILVRESKTGEAIYQRKNPETGEYEPISIFDKENTKTHQYGANQRVFKKKFEELIQDPYIWEEMQKYYPVDSFKSEGEAMFFYEKYFNIIYDCGCGYAAAANFIFHIFEGKEEEFQEKFGFPMYSMTDKGIDFNYELMMLKFFNFLHLVTNDDRKAINDSMKKDILEYRLFQLIREDAPRLSKQDTSNWTDEDWDNWKKEEKAREEKIAYLSEKYKRAKNKYTNFGIEVNGTYGYLYIFLANHGVPINTSVKFGNKDHQVDDIIATGNFTLYPINQDGEVGEAKKEFGDHYMYITDIEEDGDIIVSSWGDMYLLDNSNASWTDSVVLQPSK